MAAPWAFTLVESGLGGLTLGLMSYAKLSITGRVLGISGAVKGLVCGSQEAWRVAFVAGLLAGGAVLRSLLPTAFEAFPAEYTLWRALLAGLLVGLGTARGSGCTSGHGIAGNARLSPRSLVATLTFMLAGALAAHASGIAALYSLPGGVAPLPPLSPLTPTATFGATLLAVAVTSWLALSAAARQLTAPSRIPTLAALNTELKQATELEKSSTTAPPPAATPDAQKLAALSTAFDTIIGFLFALALGVSGMLKPSKVAGFLSVLSGSFDPSLIAIDPSLVGGAALFGAGWGLGGICPGPGLVALAGLQPQAVLFVAALVVGMHLDRTADVIAVKLVAHRYVKQRRQFGRHPHFADQGAELLLDLRPNEEHAKEWIVKQQASVAVQAAPELSEHEANTVAVVSVSKGMAHADGGWDKDDVEALLRFRKKVEKDEDYIRTVVRLGAVVEDLVKQNNAIDIYEQYFEDLPAQHLSEPPSTKTLTILRDPSGARRGAQALSWQPDGSGKLAVAYSVLEFQRQPAGMPAASHVWDTANSRAPEATLAAPVPLVSLAFNLKDHNLVGGGQYNGQVTFFDLRKGSQPVDATPVEHSHRDAVHSFAWTQSKTGSELMSTSTDGTVLWWDLRRLGGEPLESLTLRERGGEAVLGGMVVEYSPQAGPTKFMVGTEQGAILSGNRKAKNPQDRVTGSYTGHHGSIYALARNPFFPKFFLSIGDWTSRLWNEDLRTPIVTSSYNASYLTGGAWSPSRPGVFYTIGHGGVLETWDYYFKQREPVLSVQVSDRPLTSLALAAGAAPRTAAVGAEDGTVTLLQLSEGLVEQQDNERAVISAMFERESSREKNLEKSAKEAKAKARKEAAKTSEPLGAVTDEELAQLEKEFFEMRRAHAPTVARAGRRVVSVTGPKRRTTRRRLTAFTPGGHCQANSWMDAQQRPPTFLPGPGGPGGADGGGGPPPGAPQFFQPGALPAQQQQQQQQHPMAPSLVVAPASLGSGGPSSPFGHARQVQQQTNPLFRTPAAGPPGQPGGDGKRFDVENAGSVGPARNLTSDASASISPEVQAEMRGVAGNGGMQGASYGSMLPSPPPPMGGAWQPPAPAAAPTAAANGWGPAPPAAKPATELAPVLEHGEQQQQQPEYAEAAAEGWGGSGDYQQQLQQGGYEQASYEQPAAEGWGGGEVDAEGAASQQQYDAGQQQYEQWGAQYTGQESGYGQQWSTDEAAQYGQWGGGEKGGQWGGGEEGGAAAQYAADGSQAYEQQAYEQQGYEQQGYEQQQAYSYGGSAGEEGGYGGAGEGGAVGEGGQEAVAADGSAPAEQRPPEAQAGAGATADTSLPPTPTGTRAAAQRPLRGALPPPPGALPPPPGAFAPPGLQPLKLPPPPGSAASPIKAVFATTGGEAQADIKAHAGGQPLPPPPSRIPRPMGWPTLPGGPPAPADEPHSGVAAAHGAGNEAGPEQQLPPPPPAGVPPPPMMGLPHGAAGDSRIPRPGMPSFGPPGGLPPRAFAPQPQQPGLTPLMSPTAADQAAASHLLPPPQPGSATSSAAGMGPTPFHPAPGRELHRFNSGGSEAASTGPPPMGMPHRSSGLMSAGSASSDAAKLTGSFMPRPPGGAYMPGGPPGAFMPGGFAPPRPPPSPGGSQPDSFLAEQGGPALFKPGSMHNMAAADAAAKATAAATEAAPGAASAAARRGRKKRRRGLCGCLLPLLLLWLVVGGLMGAATLVVGITAAANLMHAGVATLSHFSLADAPGRQPAARATASEQLALAGSGGRLPLLLAWEPAWQRFDTYMADTSARQWDAAVVRAGCSRREPKCQWRRWAWHTGYLAGALARDAASGSLRLAKTFPQWVPQAWRVAAPAAAGFARRQGALLRAQLGGAGTAEGRAALGALLASRLEEARQLAVHLLAWGQCVRQHVTTSGVDSLASLTQPAAGCWWQHMRDYLHRVAAAEGGGSEGQPPAGGKEEQPAGEERAALEELPLPEELPATEQPAAEQEQPAEEEPLAEEGQQPAPPGTQPGTQPDEEEQLDAEGLAAMAAAAQEAELVAAAAQQQQQQPLDEEAGSEPEQPAAPGELQPAAPDGEEQQRSSGEPEVLEPLAYEEEDQPADDVPGSDGGAAAAQPAPAPAQGGAVAEGVAAAGGQQGELAEGVYGDEAAALIAQAEAEAAVVRAARAAAAQGEQEAAQEDGAEQPSAEEEAEEEAARRAALEAAEEAAAAEAGTNATPEDEPRLVAEQAAAEEAARLEAAEQAAEEEARLAAELAAEEEADCLAAQQATAEEVARLAAEQAAEEEEARLAAELAAEEEADRLAAQQATAEEVARLAAEQAAEEKAAAEEAARLAAEQAAAEEAARLAAGEAARLAEEEAAARQAADAEAARLAAEAARLAAEVKAELAAEEAAEHAEPATPAQPEPTPAPAPAPVKPAAPGPTVGMRIGTAIDNGLATVAAWLAAAQAAPGALAAAVRWQSRASVAVTVAALVLTSVALAARRWLPTLASAPDTPAVEPQPPSPKAQRGAPRTGGRGARRGAAEEEAAEAAPAPGRRRGAEGEGAAAAESDGEEEGSGKAGSVLGSILRSAQKVARGRRGAAGEEDEGAHLEDDAAAPSRPRGRRSSAAAGEEGAAQRCTSTRTPAVARIAEEEEEEGGALSDGGSRSRGTARGRRAAAAASGDEQPTASVGRTPRTAAKKTSSRLAA
ncbi:dynein intermediate chain axonemal isoform B [Micractinium conductrix]|uniref:Dynein intermediate chain axonemal isoform B n=1 Tax=Micractinium conductrix TaxID=554055 RepID=A0A2P6VAE2_9CHLO|nr:dynein intermediate chain axonemal isoform B [Micractinium conductrix]|eukprot:PSC71021.1 dynein intermediate chain axonemal isoform B [Micractinium conductrix]